MKVKNKSSKIMYSERNEVNINLAKSLATALGFNPKMVRHYDNEKINSIDILSIDDPLDNQNEFNATIGLSDIPVLINGKIQNFGVEIFLNSNKKFEYASSLLSTCAFFIGKDKWEARPGAVFNNLIEYYDKGKIMKHIYFTEPYFWLDKLEVISANSDKNVLFLLAVPISDGELKYKENNGDDALEELLFGEMKIDIFDLNRKSVV